MAVDTQQLMDARATKLGELVAQHPAVTRYKDARRAVEQDAEAGRMLAEFDRQIEALSRQQQAGMGVTDLPQQRRSLSALQRVGSFPISRSRRVYNSGRRWNSSTCCARSRRPFRSRRILPKAQARPGRSSVPMRVSSLEKALRQSHRGSPAFQAVNVVSTVEAAC